MLLKVEGATSGQFTGGIDEIDLAKPAICCGCNGHVEFSQHGLGKAWPEADQSSVLFDKGHMCRAVYVVISDDTQFLVGQNWK